MKQQLISIHVLYYKSTKLFCHFWELSLEEIDHHFFCNECDKVFCLDNQNSKAFNLIGIELEKLNLDEEAKERYLDAIYLNPENSNAYYNLGNNLIKSGKLVDAHECLDKFQKNIP